MRTPEEIIGADALLQLTFEGYEVVPAQRQQLLVEAPNGFEEFWKAYPRKAAKPDGLKAYKSARKTTQHATIMAGVARLVAEKRDPQYIPYPASWLRAEGWNDAAVQPALKGIDARRENLKQRIEDDQHRMERSGSPDPRYAGRLSYHGR